MSGAGVAHARNACSPALRLPPPTRANSLAGKVSLGDRDEQLPGLADMKRAAQSAGDELLAERRISSAQASTPAAVTTKTASLQPSDAKAAGRANAKLATAAPIPLPELPAPADVLDEFEHKLEADISTVAVTITAIFGVICFWRGVWVSGFKSCFAS